MCFPCFFLCSAGLRLSFPSGLCFFFCAFYSLFSSFSFFPLPFPPLFSPVFFFSFRFCCFCYFSLPLSLSKKTVCPSLLSPFLFFSSPPPPSFRTVFIGAGGAWPTLPRPISAHAWSAQFPWSVTAPGEVAIGGVACGTQLLFLLIMRRCEWRPRKKKEKQCRLKTALLYIYIYIGKCMKRRRCLQNMPFHLNGNRRQSVLVFKSVLQLVRFCSLVLGFGFLQSSL